MVISTAFGWGNVANIVLALVLAFFFGYLLTLWPGLRAGLSPRPFKVIRGKVKVS